MQKKYTIPYGNKNIVLEFSGTIPYHEPCAWLKFDDETSLEVCYISNAFNKTEPFFLIREHCSEKDFVSGNYKDTFGIAFCQTAYSSHDMLRTVKSIIDKKANDNIFIREGKYE